MSKEIFFSVKEKEKRIAILVDGKLVDFFIEVSHYDSQLGNIYKGRIDSIVPSINAAFVNIGEGKNGFLYLTEMFSPVLEEELSGARGLWNKILNKKKPKTSTRQFSVGDEVLVQVVKDAFGTKGPRLTTHISIAGRFLVLMPLDKQIGISRRIEDAKERERLRSIVTELKFPKVGFIVRTVSLDKGKHEILRDAKFLYRLWCRIKSLANRMKAPSLIYKEYDLSGKVIRDYFTEDTQNLFVDSRQEYLKLRRFVGILIGPSSLKRLQLYQDKLPLFESKSIEQEIRKIYSRKIHLKSGAYIVIEPTEGLTVVDVNSGSFKARLDPELAALQVNLESVPEIARQLRLRDVGGIIVIDLIDMSSSTHRRQVFTALEKALASDHAKTDVFGISKLGLVEMTRERTSRSKEALSFEVCPYCKGRGKLKID